MLIKRINLFYCLVISLSICGNIFASPSDNAQKTNLDIHANPRLNPPKVKPPKESAESIMQDFTPVALPKLTFPEQTTPTPTPVPGAFPKDPTAAALFSVVVPGLGHIYSGEPLKGLFFAAAFGVSLYLSLDNFKMDSGSNPGTEGAHNETAGSLYGLGALAAYGFGIQDAFNSAKRYNRRHYLNVSFTFKPYPTAGLKCYF